MSAMTQPSAAEIGSRFDRAIVYFGNDWDAENRTSSHQIALQLSKLAEVVYIECPGLRRPSATARDVRKLFSKLEKCCRVRVRQTGCLSTRCCNCPFTAAQ